MQRDLQAQLKGKEIYLFSHSKFCTIITGNMNYHISGYDILFFRNRKNV